ncbi:M48 family metallopeptidase [Halpernia frigidisoli]|uniref:Peptidase family M48 n=1 Tax=Halpernia frigidisoli TaxID=1125876 RepID=A0A1I3DE86_9FLAO|nr:M48 family metallopeptidase [Halpernia frigidisoli]SFH85072.1 Peptidase family M48 [Halpernia frigidisoli]
MLKESLISSLQLVLIFYLVKYTIVLINRLLYKMPIKKYQFNLKFTIIEFGFLFVTFSFFFYLINYSHENNYLRLIFIVLFTSFIPSYQFIIERPLTYFLQNKVYIKNEELDSFIKRSNINCKIRIINAEVTNAYASGILPFTKTVLVGKKMFEKFENEDLESIIYHEMGHLKLNHIWKLYLINLFFSMTFIVIIYYRQRLMANFENTVFAPLSIFIIGCIFGLLLYYIPGKVQSKFEFEADKYAVEKVGIENYKHALLSLDKISNGRVAKGGITHPTLEKRLKNISA